ncbi:MAG: dihydrolipoyl dehydrogenase [Ignavibacteriales bacterium]|nr:dihydrolipoyl dehydrogenase [Ignavibacteriales bacterium]MCB9207766.1 dihydrolipoyl dehydrogenase [Ignavibacteriales bacterium]MCB9258536.1 dihydrolipoyl dehydrogenase [Ignavibacteriales bacterium]
MSSKSQLVVVGAGPGGYAAAFLAADMGMEVTLIDKRENPGGTCLYVGCIPSKAYLHVAKLLNEAKEAHNWGVDFGEPKIDIDKMRAFKEKVVAQNTGGTGQLVKQRKINYIQGTATFINSNTVKVEKVDGGTEEVSFEHSILATGSVPAYIPGLSIDSPLVMDSTGALELENIPNRLLVIGGGVIGMELGSVYAALGSKVTVVELMPSLLPGADKDLVNTFQKSIEPKFEKILLKTKVAKLEDAGKVLKVKLEGEGLEETELEFDKALISIGRSPVTKNLGLENTKVKLTERGFVEVNEKCQTDDPKIYAIGDIIKGPMLAHKASAEGKVAVEAIAGHKVAFEPAAIPGVVYTDPEVAWVGLTETEAKEKGIKVEVARFPWAASGRARTMDRSDGITKLILEPETERVLGVGIVGPGAGELIAEGTLAIEMAATAKDVALTIHAHPTLSETVMETAEVFFGQATHLYRPKRK